MPLHTEDEIFMFVLVMFELFDCLMVELLKR